MSGEGDCENSSMYMTDQEFQRDFLQNMPATEFHATKSNSEPTHNLTFSTQSIVMPPIWNPNKRFPSLWTQFQETQDQAWNNASQKAVPRPSSFSERHTMEKEKGDIVKDGGDNELAKALIDWQGVWNDALKHYVLFPLKVNAFEEPQENLEADEVKKECPILTYIPSRLSKFTFSKSSFVFSDKTSSPKNMKKEGNAPEFGGRMMFMRCSARRVYATVEGLDGLWMVLREDDAQEEWELLDSAEMEDDSDSVGEMEDLG